MARHAEEETGGSDEDEIGMDKVDTGGGNERRNTVNMEMNLAE